MFSALIVLQLGVTFSEETVASLGYAEMQLLPEPLYSLGTDAVQMLCVKVSTTFSFDLIGFKSRRALFSSVLVFF
jgi:hypothetical protein